MKLLIGVVLLCFAVATYAAPRIVGGKEAPEGVYTYQVALRNRGWFSCGGSIIGKRWILTAAHCVQGLSHRSISVIAGTNLLQGGREQIYQSEYVTYHRGFSMSTLKNDIGLIRVNRDIEFNDKVQPMALPVEESYRAGDSAKLTGWGALRLGGSTPNKLQEIDLKLYDQTKCKRVWGQHVTNSHICTFTRAGQGSCNGDSGGPLVSGGVQVGVVSFGDRCATGHPDVFTRVHYFLDWIAAEQAKFYYIDNEFDHGMKKTHMI